MYHDADEDSWQFVSNIEYTMKETQIVSLEEITKIDSTVIDIAEIKPGYHAWRSAVGSKWHVAKMPDEAGE